MKISEQIAILIHKYNIQEISNEEKVTLDNWLAASDDHQLFFEETTNNSALINELIERQRILTVDDQERAWKKMVHAVSVPFFGKVVKPRWTWWRYSVAVAVFVCVVLIAGLLIYNTDKTSLEKKDLTNTAPTPVTPGSSGAILTLSDGRQIRLDSAASEKLGMQGDVQVENKSGRLTYVPGTGGSGPVVYNTLSTTKGQVYATVLSDGSKIWLNSASSIRYPVAFQGKDRTVSIQGEAYFEVAHNKKMPFRVIANGTEVEVTGTSFNVQSYSDETMIKTTLLEGGVKIYPHPSGSDAPSILKPGQQAQVGKDRSVVITNDVDIDAVMGWKNGLFVFHSSDIKEIMKQLERWYNIDVRYLSDVSGLTFTGTISRYDDISKVLEMLELVNKFHFKLDGNTVTISR